MLELYSKSDCLRFAEENESNLGKEDYRSDFWRDYARLLHSPSFRRLTGKTQLFPNNETDFFRNRLTHSLEVGQIAKSITKRLNHQYNLNIDEDLVSFSALTHDLGHPPFGHQGEEALDECMMKYGGFEGNAQTLRIITKIEKKLYNEEFPSGFDDSGNDLRFGLNLTYRSIASILKYDTVIPFTKKERKMFHDSRSEKTKPVKGFYKSEENIIKEIKEKIAGDRDFIGFKTIECSIMDIADDIAYSNYDLEDSFKAGFLSPIDLLYPDEELLVRVVNSVNKRTNLTLKPDDISLILIDIYGHILESTEEIETIKITEENKDDLIYYYAGNAYKSSMNIASNGALRTQMSSRLVGKFIRQVDLKLNKEAPYLSKAFLNEDTLIEVEVLKTLTYESQILSPKLKIAELRGKEIVKRIFKTINKKNGNQLLPKDYQQIYLRSNKVDKKRVICDFISGMTNNYAIQFYGRLTSENPETIFKPL
ncbi:deoxyguanosinetriphosphate triphosphohydrolase Dgt [Psychroflexus torquis ATCC 700755]|uniref:Deoxyguanosinetriphosphate triphosphohydrolase-like protein n=1 Tax=Psychroflexus torquis (strain ATCC 700755 / CIP 106069 / ACAM 623) TaxID=313595 RepID=K4IHE4_PSYTT|nr:dNTP triphosphohydrolase [Psychroflexus torquis]AFU69957.1 deoxyguanosinetriphosphate triphosphohydrolase Dgt [Psychroflexus torquis ATCC 700755]